MIHNPWEEQIDEMVRDFTKVGGMSKSEARKRFNEIIEKVRLEYEGKIKEARREGIEKGEDGHDYTIWWDKDGKHVGHLDCRKCYPQVAKKPKKT